LNCASKMNSTAGHEPSSATAHQPNSSPRCWCLRTAHCCDDRWKAPRRIGPRFERRREPLAGIILEQRDGEVEGQCVGQRRGAVEGRRHPLELVAKPVVGRHGYRSPVLHPARNASACTHRSATVWRSRPTALPAPSDAEHQTRPPTSRCSPTVESLGLVYGRRLVRPLDGRTSGLPPSRNCVPHAAMIRHYRDPPLPGHSPLAVGLQERPRVSSCA